MKSTNNILIISILLLTLFSCKEEKLLAETVVNQTLQTILGRKSIREFTEKEITNDVLNDLLKAGMAAPSSRDRRPWHFIVLTDKEIMKSLASQLKNVSYMDRANKAIIVLGDSLLNDNCWELDCSAASQNILIAAESMGLGATWTAVFPYEDRTDVVKKAFELPDNIHPFAIIPLGYPLAETAPKNKFDEQRIHQNRW